MTNDAYARLIQALREAGIDAHGEDPLVPYEDLITREDALFAREIMVGLW